MGEYGVEAGAGQQAVGQEAVGQVGSLVIISSDDAGHRRREGEGHEPVDVSGVPVAGREEAAASGASLLVHLMELFVKLQRNEPTSHVEQRL